MKKSSQNTSTNSATNILSEGELARKITKIKSQITAEMTKDHEQIKNEVLSGNFTEEQIKTKIQESKIAMEEKAAAQYDTLIAECKASRKIQREGMIREFSDKAEPIMKERNELLQKANLLENFLSSIGENNQAK